MVAAVIASQKEVTQKEIIKIFQTVAFEMENSKNKLIAFGRLLHLLPELSILFNSGHFK